MGTEVLFTKHHYKPQVTWDDVIKKIDCEFEKKTVGMSMSDNSSPTIVCHNYQHPKTIMDCIDQVRSEFKVDSCHVYVSFSKNAKTYGRHNDNADVLLVQAIGKVSYAFDDATIYTLEPGDSLFIPKHVYHDPYTLSPRATLSFGILL